MHNFDGTIVAINRKSGSAMGLVESDVHRLLLDQLSAKLDVRFLEPDDLQNSLQSIFETAENKTVIVAGGDGTVSLAGSLALKHGTRLGVLPLGTMNLFARAMGMPIDLNEAVHALKHAQPHTVDVGDFNGEIFLNHMSMGLHPKVIQIRDQLPRSGRLSKIWNTMRAYWRIVSQPRNWQLRVSGDFEPFRVKAGLAVVAVNPVPEKMAHLPYREGQSYGKLACYVSTHRNARQLNVLFTRLAAGLWHQSDHMEYREGETVTIECAGPLHISIDGEVKIASSPLVCTIRKGALAVLRPPVEFPQAP